MEKGIIYPSVEITGLGATGNAVARVTVSGSGREAPMVVFVRDAAPGDVADVEIIRRKKSYLTGRVVNFHKRSEARREPFCEHFGVCGGCQWQHIAYEEQIRHKQRQAEENFARIGKIKPVEWLPVIPAPQTTRYRNRLDFSFSAAAWLTEEERKNPTAEEKKNALGFHIPGMYDKVLHLHTCHLQADLSDEIRLAAANYSREQGLEFYDIRRKAGFLRHLTIRNTTTGEWMVLLCFGYEHPEKRNGLLRHLRNKFSRITALFYAINGKANDSLDDVEVFPFSGKEYITEVLPASKKQFRIGPKTFFQTNTVQAERLFRVVSEFASFTGKERVFDLYTGIGAIACFIAGEVKQVIGIEQNREAVEHAKENALLNGIENTFFYAADAARWLSAENLEKHGKPDVLITDPPRAGMHPLVIRRILEILPERIIYVSCNSATQARDLALLCGPYTPVKAQPIDMFPHTVHVENVVLLERYSSTTSSALRFSRCCSSEQSVQGSAG